VRRYAALEGVEIPSILAGKIATATIYWGAFVFAVATVPQTPIAYVEPLRWLGIGGLVAGLAFSCYAGGRYTLALGGARA
jgi:hypothetical protein